MAREVELRHLRYFVAVAEEGSLTVAAERRLHTAEPSLSRQIRDLEAEVGAELMTRSARGIELTAAGRVFLDHARLALAQVEAAASAARRACHVHRHVSVLTIGSQYIDTGPHARSSIWRDRMAENSSANPSRRWACRFTSEVNLL